MKNGKEEVGNKSRLAIGMRKSDSTNWLRLLLLIFLGTGLSIALAIFLSPMEPLPDLTSVDDTAPTVAQSDRDTSLDVKGRVPFPLPDNDLKVENLKLELLNLGDFLASDFEMSAEALHVAAMIFFELKQTKKAEDTWRKCIVLKPSNLGPYVGLASVLSQRGDDAQSVEILEEIRETGQKSAELFTELASGLSKMGKLDRADEILKEGLLLYPDNASLYIQSGMINSQLRRFETAEIAFRRAVEFGDSSKSTLIMLANALARLGKATDAREVRAAIELADKRAALQDSKSFEDTYLKTLIRLAGRFLQLGSHVAIANGKPLLAEKWLLRSIAIDAKDFASYMELSTVYRRTNRLEEALDVQKRLLELQPQNVLNHINLASVASQLGKNDLAELVLAKAIDTDPEVAFPYAELARIHLAKREFSLAKERIKRAQSLEPQNLEWHLMGAIVAEKLGDAAGAIECIQRAQKIAPDDPRTLSWLKATKSGN